MKQEQINALWRETIEEMYAAIAKDWADASIKLFDEDWVKAMPSAPVSPLESGG